MTEEMDAIRGVVNRFRTLCFPLATGVVVVAAEVLLLVSSGLPEAAAVAAEGDSDAEASTCIL